MSSKKSILYVDDEEINIKLFEFNFSEKYEVISGCCGSTGLNLLDTHPDIRVVLSDMKMPKMSGLEFIRLAKEKFADKKFFIITGYDITEEIRSAIENNLIVKYFQKPFRISEIDAAIAEAAGD